MRRKFIPIFFTIDEAYVPYLSVCIASLIDHISLKKDYKIHILYTELKKESIDNLKSLKTDNVEIDFFNMYEKIEPYKKKFSNKVKLTHFPITIYLRLFIPSLFPEYDKGIYLDSDIVLNEDIAKMYKVNIKDNYIGGCVDTSVITTPFADYYENYVGVSRFNYINSGVLLMNMKKLREVKFDQKFIKTLLKYDFEAVEPDQAYINALCKDKIYYLDNKWDTMPILGKKGIKNPKLIHYNLFYKPWHYDIEYDKYFWKYAHKSIYKDFIVKEKNNYNDNDKIKDKKTSHKMLDQAARLRESDISFKNNFYKE